MKRQPHLVLSLFPGIGLLDRAFEELGFCVVRGPDILWGGDVRTFHPPARCFDGLIVGPPCQTHSTASAIRGTDAIDLIPEYLRVWEECGRPWSVMENVNGAMNHSEIPKDWHPARLRDWDCGGFTNRKRSFWTWPFMAMDPTPRPGKASHSVMATTWKRGKSSSQYVIDKGFLPGDLPVLEYGRLQGAQDIAQRLIDHKSGKAFAVHCLGNGVPLAMGRYMAQQALQFSQHEGGAR